MAMVTVLWCYGLHRLGRLLHRLDKRQTIKNLVRYTSWSEFRKLLHISSRRSPFVRCSSQIRYTSLRCSSRRLYSDN